MILLFILSIIIAILFVIVFKRLNKAESDIQDRSPYDGLISRFDCLETILDLEKGNYVYYDASKRLKALEEFLNIECGTQNPVKYNKIKKENK